MTAREMPDRRLARDERAVSPVIGMILVLAISVVGMATILYWGLPAIDEMKANVEFRSVEGQFLELDATVKELVSGTTEKTAKRWQPTFNRGSLIVRNETEGWLFAIERVGNDADFIWANLSDGNESFTILSLNATSNVVVEAHLVKGSVELTKLSVSHNANTAPAQMVATDLGTWAAGETRVFKLFDAAGAPVRIEDGTFKFSVYSGSKLLSEAWYMPTGRIEYSLAGGLGDKALVANNGIVMAGSSGSYAVVSPPSIPPQTNTTGVHRFFGRAITIDGNVSFGGDDRFEVLVSLVSTKTLASYDCADDDAYTDCVRTAKIFNYGTRAPEWNAYLTGRGYDFVEKKGRYDAVYLEDREGYMAYTLLQSHLELR